MHCWNFSSNVGRVAGSLQDAPLAFAVNRVKQVADSTSQTRTRVSEVAQSNLNTWCGKKMTPNNSKRNNEVTKISFAYTRLL